MSEQNIYDLADTWNDAGTTFTAIKMNVTDTASNAASLLMDLQVGGVSRLNVDKTGAVFSAGNTFGTPTRGKIAWVSDGYFRASNSVASSYFDFNASGAISLAGEGNDIFAMRRGVNAQEFRLYNTYTDGSNYERGGLKWNSNVLEVVTEAAGGTRRNVVLNGANRAAKITDVSSGTDTAYETAINAIIDALEAHGISATS